MQNELTSLKCIEHNISRITENKAYSSIHKMASASGALTWSPRLPWSHWGLLSARPPYFTPPSYLKSWICPWPCLTHVLWKVWVYKLLTFSCNSIKLKFSNHLSYQNVCSWVRFLPEQCNIVQSAVLRLHVVCLSVCDVGGYDHIGWKSWKLIARAISPTSLLFVAQRSPPISRGTWRNFGEKMFVQHLHVRP